MPDQLTVKCKPFSALAPDELYDVLRVRQEVFMLEQKCLYLDLDGYDQSAFHLMILNKEKTLVAYARLFDTGMPYPGFLSIGRVVVHPQHRKKAYGRYLMKEAIEQVRQLFGQHPIKIGAQAYLTTFYNSFGFSDIHQYYLEDGIPHLKMVLG